MSKLIMTEAAIPGYIAGAPLHTDDNALLEYSAPRALQRDRSAEILAALYAHRQNPLSVLRSGQSAAIPPAMAREFRNRFAARKDVLAGFSSYRQGAAQEAMERLEQALAISPQDYDAANLLAKLYYRIGNRFKEERRLDEAVTAYEKSVATTENFIRVCRDSLSNHFELAVTYSRANYYLGTLALDAGRLERAEAAFEKSISAGVPYADAHNNMGVVHERRGEYEAALNQYRLALALDSNLVSAYMNMGNTQLKQKRYAEAIASYRQVKKLSPNFALTHYNLGVAYFEQNEWAEAEKEWTRALALKPDFEQAHQGLKTVRQRMEKP
jgi:tetratricopeptide (TPR) repeat protein